MQGQAGKKYIHQTYGLDRDFHLVIVFPWMFLLRAYTNFIMLSLVLIRHLLPRIRRTISEPSTNPTQSLLMPSSPSSPLQKSSSDLKEGERRLKAANRRYCASVSSLVINSSRK